MEQLKVFVAKRIRTMDAGRPVATAVAVKDGRIVSVGSLETMKPWLDRHPHEIDERFKDQVLFPGFIDPHTHFRISGTLMGLNYIGPLDQEGPRGVEAGLKTRAQVLAALKRAVQASAPGQPVLAWGLDPAVQGGTWIATNWTRCHRPTRFGS